MLAASRAPTCLNSSSSSASRVVSKVSAVSNSLNCYVCEILIKGKLYVVRRH